VSYAELAAASNFSFLRGASHPDEMVLQAKALGLAALGLADRNTCAGLVRAHAAAKEHGLRFLPGARLVTEDGLEAIAYPQDRAAYGRLCRLLTLGNRRAPKGQCWFSLEELCAHAEGLLLVLLAPAAFHLHREQTLAFPALARRLVAAAPDRSALFLALTRTFGPGDYERLHHLAQLAEDLGVAPLAVQDALYHHPERRPLADVLHCIRTHVTIDQAGLALEANAERHLKPPEEMARLFKGYEEAIATQAQILERARFSLDELRYEYPDEVVSPGETPMQSLMRLTWEGAAERYPDGVPEKVRKTIEHEFQLIAQLDYAKYFLTVRELVRFARSRDILCQGRGSAANSTVCYCLGITAVNPAEIDLLFERFVSAERKEPPDIDVDFEHERREEVIQHIYGKYGRDRAGIAATVITYRGKSAIREVGKALGLSGDTVEALAKTLWGWSAKGVERAHVVGELGLDPEAPRLKLALELSAQLIGFPRHLSQHVGGFVITRGPLEEMVPIGNAAMADRTFIEWDKDDLDALGLLKIDVLALGMLTAIAKSFDMLRYSYGVDLDLARLPREDPAVYDMICEADTVGVFQIESRAQMSMLPRLKPRCFYDLVIEVAIVRPGPIQGDMVHPYLRRREGLEAVSFPSKALEEVLGKTLGVPLFQEQAMRIAIVAAGFTPAEADKLRRAMATFRKVGIIHQFGLRLVEGMVERGYARDFAERCFKQIEGFGEYGFPESHAASFAHLVYVSAWIKKHWPEVFCAALLNAQPMGFYAPAQLVRDAKAHGVRVLPPDVNCSDWECVLGGGGLRSSLAPLQGTRDGIHDVFGAGQDVVVPVPQNLVALRKQPGVSLAVVDAVDMLASVSLDDEFRFKAHKIDNVTPNRMLPAKTIPQLAPSQSNPKAHFGLGEIGSQAACESVGHNHPYHAGVQASLLPLEGGGGRGAAGGGVQFPHPLSLAASRRDSSPLEGEQDGRPRRPVRLGLRLIKGFSEADAAKLVAARQAGGPFKSVEDLRRRARLSHAALERLAHADAFRSLGLDRRRALWEAAALKPDEAPLFAQLGDFGPEVDPALPDMPLCEHVAHDYARLQLSLKAHPLRFFRERLVARGAVRAVDLERLPSGRRLEIAGLVLVRQRPGSARGVIFITLEDETGAANLIVWPKVFERFRKQVLGARLLLARGRLQKEGKVIHLVCDDLADRSEWLAELTHGEVDLHHEGLARADEVRGGVCAESRAVGEERQAAKRARAAKILPKSRDFH